MKKTEIVKLFALIRSEYANFESTEEKRMLWHELMADMTFEKAVTNVKEFMTRSSYPPTAADVIRRDPEVFTDYDQLREDTQTYLQQREEWQQKAIACPPQFSRKHLTAGGGDANSE